MKSNKPIGQNVRIGHVHLKVADLERALEFYCGVLGFELTVRLGRGAAFVSAGGYHHHIGLNTWESLGGSPPLQGTTGLYHLAILYPTRAELADALRRVMTALAAAENESSKTRSGPAVSPRCQTIKKSHVACVSSTGIIAVPGAGCSRK